MGPVAPRHSLVWLRRDAEDSALFAQETELPLIRAWLALGHPFVARRAEADTPEAAIALGLAAPLRLGRRRIAFCALPSLVDRTECPPLLAQALASAPEGWDARLRPLVEAVSACGVDLRVYGSLGLEHVTGEAYLRAESDVDLLAIPRRAVNEAALKAVLTPFFALVSPRLDGELMLADGGAVALREWASASPQLLVKSHAGVRLVARGALAPVFAASDEPLMAQAAS